MAIFGEKKNEKGKLLFGKKWKLLGLYFWFDLISLFLSHEIGLVQFSLFPRISHF